jgi:acetyl-CoA acetyltransferase
VTGRLERRAIVSGIGMSSIGRRLGVPSVRLAVDASLAAITDAGLTVADIDGLASMGDAPTTDVKEALGAKLNWIGTSASFEGSGGHLRFVMDACMAVATGLCDHVLVYRSVSMLSGEIPLNGAGEWAWHLPFHEYSAATMTAKYACRHMYEYGTTREQLGAIAINARKHAALNERAVLKTPITMDDYLSAKWIAEPLGLLDCDLPIDGAAAFVISRADFAQDCPRPAVRFEAIGCAIHGGTTWDSRENYPGMAGTEAAAHMWSRTDLKPSDVDVAEIYDGFTFLTLTWLEALGFCGVGEGGPFVEGGARIGLTGELPLNTYGGQLSAGRLHGYWVLHEAVLQLRGDAGARQVADAEVAVVTAGGGHRMGCLLLTR